MAQAYAALPGGGCVSTAQGKPNRPRYLVIPHAVEYPKHPATAESLVIPEAIG